MKTILVPLDGSTCAELILPFIRRLAPILNARLHLVKVVSDLPDDQLAATTGAQVYYRSQGLAANQRQRAWYAWETKRRHAVGYLESHAAILQSEGMCVSFEARLGDPAEEITAAAGERHAALIAMATHGYSGLRRWSLGSVMRKVVQSATMPVFVVHGGQPGSASVAFERIVVPLDGSDLAQQALPFAAELAIGASAELTLLHVVPPAGEALVAMRAQASKALDDLAGELRQRDVPVATLVANGHAAEVIADQANQRHADLIVMATHARSGLKRWALGSVADRVLQVATTPIVMVHAQAAA